MDMIELHEYMESYKKLEDSLSTTVKISNEQVTILVVKDLIAKRNACNDERQKAFDIVLRWYIDEGEFKRFVIMGEEVT
jgi:predicted metal-binding transcription factor (methanogenesis marker protein 9)